MITVDAKAALEALRLSVLRYGMDTEYIDQDPEFEPGMADCKYVRGAQPMCIVGVALSEFLEVPVSKLRRNGIVSVVAERLRNQGAIDLSYQAVAVLKAAQQAQDNGEEWGVALEHAYQRYAELTAADDLRQSA